MKIFSKRRAGIALLLVLATCALFFLRDRSEIEWLSSPPAVRTSSPVLGKWSWPIKAQLRRFKERLLKKPQLVVINGRVLEFDSVITVSNLSSTLTGFTNTSGDRVYVVEDAFQKQLEDRAGVRVIANGKPLMSIYENIPGQTGAYSDKFAWQIQMSARVKAQSVSLVSFFRGSQQMSQRSLNASGANTNLTFTHTNFFFGARVEIPDGHSVFLLSGATNGNGKITAALLSPSVPRTLWKK